MTVAAAAVKVFLCFMRDAEAAHSHTPTVTDTHSDHTPQMSQTHLDHLSLPQTHLDLHRLRPCRTITHSVLLFGNLGASGSFSPSFGVEFDLTVGFPSLSGPLKAASCC
ncbi:hypothetical protein CRENBAI_013646 [Crenichthys baileyi]|uniref:Secreted protein n=1 Tax=Crenichthys baileyi TaxID=28760 RepID=A0AAV9RM52_9TELE